MKVALFTYSTKPRGGVVHTLALAEVLVRCGHDVEVWTLGRDGDTGFFRQVDPAVVVHVIPFAAHGGETVGDRIERSITTMAQELATDADIIHAQDCISANAVIAAGRRCIRTVHHLDAFTTPRLVECHDRAITEPDALVCVSRAVATEVEVAYGRSATVIPNGVDADRFAAAADPANGSRRALWRRCLGDYVLALGGIEPRKGSIDLLEAYALARDRHPGLRLVFGGGETLFDYRDYRARFERRAAGLGIEPIVLGTLADEDVPDLVAAARMLGFASVKEGFGLAAMEALAAGVPVVARDLPVTREVFGDAVLYADGVDGIRRGIDAAMDGGAPPPERGRALAARHTWPAAAAEHERFYAAVLDRAGGDRATVDLAHLR